MSFTIRRGECLGLVGESGSGKTTVSKILTRAVTADTGSVIFDDGQQQVDVLKLRRAPVEDVQSRACRWCSRTRSARSSPRMTVA